MRTMKLLVLTWSLLVGTVVLAKAEDRVEVPNNCHLKVDAMINVHVVLCHDDLECTQRIVDVLCDYNTVLPNPYK